MDPRAPSTEPNEADDATLARRIAEGGEDSQPAEAELYRRLAPRVRLYGLRHLRQRADADDLAQDVMLLTFDALRAGQVREPERLASFVLGTCRRVVSGSWRGVARRERLLERYGRDLVPAAVGAEPLLDREQLAECLKRLGERERSVVVLSFFVERPGDEIARELGLEPGHLRVVRHRALARLRTCLGGEPA